MPLRHTLTRIDSLTRLTATLAILFFSITSAHAQFLGSWDTVTNYAHIPRWYSSAAAVDGKIYQFGGVWQNNLTIKNWGIYDPATATWEFSISETWTTTPRSFTSCGVIDGKIYLIGGTTDDNQSGPGSSIVEIFDPITMQMTTPTVTGTFAPRRGSAGATIGDKIYIIGGISDTTIIETVDVFDAKSASWTTLQTTGAYHPRSSKSVAVIDGKIYVLGGWYGTFSDRTYTSLLEIFDPATNSWSTPEVHGSTWPRGNLATAVLDGKLYAMGGATFDPAAPAPVDVFDPSTNTWSKAGDLDIRYGSAAAVAGGKIYLLDGGSSQFELSKVWTPSTSSVRSTPASPAHLAAYPNPASNSVTFSGLPTDLQQITITNILGQQIQTLKPQTRESYSLDLKPLAPGTYFVRAISPTSTQTTTLVKQ